MAGAWKSGTYIHRRFELAGARRRYCEVEVTKRALSDWVVVVRRGTCEGKAKPKTRQKKFFAGVSAKAAGEREIARLRGRGYREVRLPKGASKKKIRKEPPLERGAPLVRRCIEALRKRKSRAPHGGDEKRLAAVRLKRGTKLPPTLQTLVTLSETKVRTPASLLDTRLRGKLFRLPSVGEQLHFLYAWSWRIALSPFGMCDRSRRHARPRGVRRQVRLGRRGRWCPLRVGSRQSG